jgi:2-methylcitrate dehydratase PrpD
MGRSGRDLIAATVLTYEVFCRVSDVLDNRAIGMDYATVIGLAAVAGAGRMLELTPQQIVHAIGIYVAGNVALNQTRVATLSNWKACAAAEASRKAIFAVQLAQNAWPVAPLDEKRSAPAVDICTPEIGHFAGFSCTSKAGAGTGMDAT